MAEVEEKKNTKYEIHDGLLYFINGGNKRLFLTKGIIHDLIDKCHEMYAHIGPLKVMKMLNDFFYYPKMAKIVRRRLANCDSCQIISLRGQMKSCQLISMGHCQHRKVVSNIFCPQLMRFQNTWFYIQ